MCGGKETKVECYPGIRINQMKKRIQERKQGDAGVVILHVGTNNVKGHGAHSEIIGEMWELIREAKDKFKGAEVVVSGILRSIP